MASTSATAPTTTNTVHLLDLAAACVACTQAASRAIQTIAQSSSSSSSHVPASETATPTVASSLGMNPRSKPDGSCVTDADYAAQGIIVQVIRAVSPHVRILGEESDEEMARHMPNDTDDNNNNSRDPASLFQRCRLELAWRYANPPDDDTSTTATTMTNDAMEPLWRLPLSAGTAASDATFDPSPHSVKDTDTQDDMAALVVDTARVTVIVDPLDGTKAYTNGDYDAVSILIAIALDNEPYFGVICKPFGYQTVTYTTATTNTATEELAAPAHGVTTMLDSDCVVIYGGPLLRGVYVAGGRTIRAPAAIAAAVSPPPPPAQSLPTATTTTATAAAATLSSDNDTVASTTSNNNNNNRSGLPRAVISSSRSTGVVLDFCAHLAQHELIHPDPLLISGAGEKSLRLILHVNNEALWFFPKAGTSLWDVAAPDALLRSLGGKVTDKWGRSLDYSKSRADAENGHGVVACIDANLHANCMALWHQGDWLTRE